MALSTNQKWLIGCGGCLGVIVLVMAVIIGAAALWHQGSVDMVARLMGKEPAGYMTLVGVEDKKLTFAALFSGAEKDVLVIVKSPEDPTFKEIQKQPDTKDPQKLAEVQSLLEQSMAANSRSRSMDKLQLEAVTSLNVSGKRFKGLDIKMSSDSGNVVPMFAVVVPQPDKQDVLLISLDFSSQSSDPQEDFTAVYAQMNQSMAKIISGSRLLKAVPATAGTH